MADKFLIAYVLVALVCWPVITGMLFRDTQGRWPTVAAEMRRQDLGTATMFGLFFAAVWPMGLPIMFCLTGFAEFGIFRQKHGVDDKVKS